MQTRPSRSWRRSRSSSRPPSGFWRWVHAFPRVCCSTGPRARARRSWPVRSQVRPVCRSSRSRAPTSWRCSWASGQAVCVTSLSRRSRTPRASSSWTRSTPSAVTAVRAWVAGTTSASRRSTSCWWRWMGLSRRTTSSSSPPPTVRTSSTRPFSVRAASIARSWWTAPTVPVAPRSCACTPAASPSRRTSTSIRWPDRPRGSPAPTWPTLSTRPRCWPRARTRRSSTSWSLRRASSGLSPAPRRRAVCSPTRSVWSPRTTRWATQSLATSCRTPTPCTRSPSSVAGRLWATPSRCPPRTSS